MDKQLAKIEINLQERGSKIISNSHIKGNKSHVILALCWLIQDTAKSLGLNTDNLVAGIIEGLKEINKSDA